MTNTDVENRSETTICWSAQVKYRLKILLYAWNFFDLVWKKSGKGFEIVSRQSSPGITRCCTPVCHPLFVPAVALYSTLWNFMLCTCLSSIICSSSSSVQYTVELHAVHQSSIICSSSSSVQYTVELHAVHLSVIHYLFQQ